MTWVLNDAQIPAPTPAGMPSATALSMVLLGLANHASRDGEDAYPSVKTLARYARISERQVQRCLAALLDLGLIELGNQRIVQAKIEREDRRPTCYNLLIHTSPQPVHSGVTGRHPVPERGDTQDSNGVTRETERGDTHVTRTVLEPRDKPAAAHVSEPTSPSSSEPERRRPKIDDLETRIRGAGLWARFDGLSTDEADLIDTLISVQGIDRLVAVAVQMHRKDDPARSVKAWLPTWRAMPVPHQPATPAPKCSTCEGTGFVIGPDDLAIYCECRNGGDR